MADANIKKGNDSRCKYEIGNNCRCKCKQRQQWQMQIAKKATMAHANIKTAMIADATIKKRQRWQMQM